MLSLPKAGWTKFSLGTDIKHELSYLTDIPMDWLTEAARGLRIARPFVVFGNCEPGRVLVIVSYWNIHVVFEDEDGLGPMRETSHTYENMNMLEFCKELYNDISEDLEGWALWGDFITNEEKQEKMKKRIPVLEKKLKELEEAISLKKDKFNSDKSWYF